MSVVSTYRILVGKLYMFTTGKMDFEKMTFPNLNEPSNN